MKLCRMDHKHCLDKRLDALSREFSGILQVLHNLPKFKLSLARFSFSLTQRMSTTSELKTNWRRGDKGHDYIVI